MPVSRRTLSISLELDEALGALSIGRGESVSAVAEMLLREHPLVRQEIEIGRAEDGLPDVMAVPGRTSSFGKKVKASAKRPSS